jgi:hypothetical protein
MLNKSRRPTSAAPAKIAKGEGKKQKQKEKEKVLCGF